MVAISVSKLRRRKWQLKQIREKRNKNKKKRTLHNEYRKILYKKPKIVKHKIYTKRESRNRCRVIYERKRDNSIPFRGRNSRTEKIRTMNNINTKQWIIPFKDGKKPEPVINLTIDGKEIEGTIDTGATRVMMTSTMAERLWGTNYQVGLRSYAHRSVRDAQGNRVEVYGFKIANIEIGTHLKARYPVVIYKAQHDELLIGYTFLCDFNLNIYSSQGIGTNPNFEVVKKLNFAEEKLECTPMQTEVVQPKSIKTIKASIKFPIYWDKTDKNKAIGAPMVTHSEHLEPALYVTQLTCPYTYDILSPEQTINVLIDNSDGIEKLVVKKGQVIAHTEFLHEEVPPESINRILKNSSYSIGEETQPGEYKLHEQEEIKRYDYVDKINIKSNEPGTEEFCKDLLYNTEEFWSKSTFDMGKFDRKAHMTLKTTTPVWDKYRPINPNKEQQAQEIIDQLEKHNIISRANSPFCSQPVWCYKKYKDKEGKEAIAGEADYETPRALRLALDYRKINKLIASNCHFPNPSIRQILFKLKSAKYVSIMDLTNSYWHIELTESTKPILAFQTSTAQYVWQRLPQGTAPSMSIMAEAVQDTIYSGGIADCTTCYVDNIIVTSDNLENHKKDLARTIAAFQHRGWKANPAKSHVFINTECRLFGFHINLKDQTIGPDPQKVKAIMELPEPTNQKSARSICGSINYYSDLIPDLANLMMPLHEATKNNKFNWTKECKTNFELIKTKLAKLPVVFMPDFNQKMHLFTDAAMGQYLGYHISQYKPSLKKFVPIAWGSHKFSASEKSMSQPEAELFAIVHALIQESLLLGFSRVVVHTDCKSLTYLFRFAKICSKLTRWQLILASYDLEVYFEPSTSVGIQISDLLSRRPEKRMTNRKPKPSEIEELPNIPFQEGTNLTFQQAKEVIVKHLALLPPLTGEQIMKLSMLNDHDETIPPDQLECNAMIINKLANGNDKIEDYTKKNYQPQFVFTPDQMKYKDDISPSGRLLNFVLQEAPGLSLAALRQHQDQDLVFGPILRKMITDKKVYQNYAIKDGILLKEVQNWDLGPTYVICVPKSLSLELIGKFHYSIFGSHPDVKKLMANLKKRFFIKNLKNECIHITKTCQICIANKSFNKMHQPYGTKITVTGPRQIYALDICTVDTQATTIDPKLPSSFLIITDVWCLFSIAVPVNADISSRDILEKFSLHVTQPYGIPRVGILTDGAKNFSCQLSNTFTAVLGLHQFRISPYNARSNPAERINRAILSGLRYALQQHDLQPEVFKNIIHYIVLAWNTSVLSHLDFSPYQLFLSTNYEPAALTSFVTIQEANNLDYGDFISSLVKTQHIIENLVNERFQKTRDKRYKDKEKHSKRHIYSPGMQVMIKNRIDQTQRVHKLRPRYSGPYKIVREFENNVEVIDWRPNRKVQVIHKYKNEARNIPMFERYLIGKDRVKPCGDLTYYYDENLSRRFYQEFWDLIRDVQPITEVERIAKPSHYEDKVPDHRPSSLIFPAHIGVKHSPLAQTFPKKCRHGPNHFRQPRKKGTASTHTSSSPGSEDDEDKKYHSGNKNNTNSTQTPRQHTNGSTRSEELNQEEDQRYQSDNHSNANSDQDGNHGNANSDQDEHHSNTNSDNDENQRNGNDGTMENNNTKNDNSNDMENINLSSDEIEEAEIEIEEAQNKKPSKVKERTRTRKETQEENRPFTRSQGSLSQADPSQIGTKSIPKSQRTSRKRYDPKEDHRSQTKYSITKTYPKGIDYQTRQERIVSPHPPIREKWTTNTAVGTLTRSQLAQQSPSETEGDRYSSIKLPGGTNVLIPDLASQKSKNTKKSEKN